jgi:hypothetical protein
LHLLFENFLIHSCFSGFFQNTVFDLKERNREENTGDDGVVSVAFELQGGAEGAEVNHAQVYFHYCLKTHANY